MKRLPALFAFVLSGTCLCAGARESSDRNIVLACPPGRATMMADVVRAIEVSHYGVSRPARREMLARARAACAAHPAALLSFTPVVRQADGRIAAR